MIAVVRNLLSVALRMIMVVFMVSGLKGCSSSVTDAELAGRYLCLYPYGAEVLVLRSDGTYTQLIDVNVSDGSIIHHGKWQHDSQAGNIVLIDPVVVDNNFGSLRPSFKAPESGKWVLTISSRFRTISLRWHPDFDYEFRRL